MDSLKEVVMSRFRSGRLGRVKKVFGVRKIRAGIALGCALAVLLSAVAVAVATGAVDDSNAPPGDWAPVYNDEALPCTGPKEPVNFETFSPGPSVAGLPLTVTVRRCDGGPIAERANYVSYIYGGCEIVEGATGCQPPLEVQTWPACQRFPAKYSFRGKPLPRRNLAKNGGADVVEFDFALDNRIEVYTKSVTIVIFAVDRGLATKAVDLLRPREQGKRPATDGDALSGKPAEWLGPPREGALEGGLSCRS